MTKLSLRLKSAANFVNEGSKIIDVGCDHGLLDVYLAQNKNCHCLATDISATCLKKTIENIKKYNVQDRVTTKVTNGLEGTSYENYDYVIITGMGFSTIKKILENKYPNKLIIQSNNNIVELRYWILKKYKLVKEDIVFESGIYYVILYLELGSKKYKYDDYFIGLNKDNIDYINYLYEKYKKIYNQMPNKYLLQKIKLYRKILILKKHKRALI